ncbi:hypothetical protein [Adhaeretor mobilis]|uniref:Uncharacterized protein n=1 Tax=Adhaeretor mobilis TaxID=1930276 RepID=A0A517MRF2_9BACT|nr:hypothetical protein [Adhaeretor mobilis]QDS97377.1 hypothetical protein HG15A2_06380 [Adhaeretor mobilis]
MSRIADTLETAKRFLWAALGSALICLLCVEITWAELSESTSSAEDVEQSLEFRKIFVPESRLEAWPTNNERLLPMDLKAFEELAQSLDDRREKERTESAQFESAVHTAFWTPEEGFTGTSLVTVKRYSDTPQLLALENVGIVLLSARWHGAPEDPPQLALWKQPNRDTLIYGLLANRSGPIELHWKQLPEKQLSTGIVYRFKLSGAARQSLQLSLPGGYEPKLSSAAEQVAPVSQEDGQQRWEFQLAGGAVQRLTIAPGDLAERGSVHTQLRVTQKEDYQLESRGLTYTTTLLLDEASLVNSVVLQRSELLDLFEIAVDGQPATWRWLSPKEERLVIDLPQQASRYEVKVIGSARLVKDRGWRLPVLRPEAQVWSQGTCRLHVDRHLVLQSMKPSGFRLVNTSGIDSELPSDEIYELLAAAEQSRLEVTLSSRPQQLSLEKTTLVKLGERSSTSRITLTLDSKYANTFQLMGEILSGWQIEAVQAENPSDLAHWHVTTSEDHELLHLQLHRSPSPNKPVRLIVDARRAPAAAQLPAALGEFDWLSLGDAKLTQEWLAVQTLPEVVARLSSQSTEALVPKEQYELEDFGLNQLSQRLLVIDLTHLSRDIQIVAATQAPEFDAQGFVRVATNSTGMDYEVELACQPAQGGVQALVVDSSVMLPPKAQWMLGSEKESLPVEVSERSSNGLAGSYLVKLPQLQLDPFTLRVKYRRVFDISTAESEHPIDGFFLPEATQWQAWALIDVKHDVPSDDAQNNDTRSNGTYSIDQRGSTPVTPPWGLSQRSFHSRHVSELLGCFRFDIDQPLSVSKSPAIIYMPTRKQSNKTQGNSGIDCAQATVTTTHSESGLVRGTVLYELFPLGDSPTSDSLSFELARNTKLHSAEYDGKPIAVDEVSLPSTKSSTFYRIAVSVSKHGILKLHYAAQAEKLSSGEEISAHAPTPSFTVAQGRWNLWLPEGFSIAKAHRKDTFYASKHSSPISQELTIAERLFGPLARSGISRRFDPFAGDSNIRQLRTIDPMEAYPVSVNPSTKLATRAGDQVSLGGWRLHERKFTETPLPVKISLLLHQRGLWLAVWLVSTVLACISLGRWLRYVIIALGIVSLLCLVLPEDAIALPQACFLGCLTGMVLCGIFRLSLAKSSMPEPPVPELRGTRATVVASLLLGCSMCLTPESVFAKEALPTVLIPVEPTTQEPTGEVYLPTNLLREMQRAVELQKSDGASWVMLAARHLVSLDQVSANQPVEGRESVLAFRIQTFAPEVAVQLPLDEREAIWLGKKHTLNGRPLPVSWSKSSAGCELQIPEQGVYEVRLYFTPLVKREDGRAMLNLTVPPLTGTQLELTTSGELPELQIEGGIERPIDFSPERAEQLPARYVLGATNELAISWKPVASQASEALRVEQLEWLTVDKDQITGKVKLRLTGDELPEELHLAHPSAMELTTATDGNGGQLITKPHASGSVLPLPAGLSLPLEIDLNFQISRPVVGNIHFPYFYVNDAVRVRRLFAATISSDLEFQEVQRSKLRSLSAAEFASLWGDQARLPTLAYVLLSRTPEWTLQVSPADELVVASQRLDLHCRSVRADLNYQATIANSDGLFSLRLSVPESLTIDELSLVNGQLRKIPLRWTRPEAAVVEIFTARRLSASCELQLQGSLSYEPSPQLLLPRISLIGAEQSPLTLRVTRSFDVNVELLGVPVERESSSVGLIQKTETPALPVVELELTRSAYPEAKLRVAPVEANFNASTATVLVSETAVDFVLSLETNSGRLERFSFLAPAEWQHQDSSDESYLLYDRSTDADGRHRLEFLLTTPLDADRRTVLRIPGKLTPAGNHPLRVPDIKLLSAHTQAHYVVVPSKLNDVLVDWQIRGLHHERIPAPLDGMIPEISHGQSLRAVLQNPLVEQRVFPEAMRHAAIRFAENSGVLDEHGNWAATTRFVLQPARATSCTLKMPPRSKLLALELAGRRSLPQLTKEGTAVLNFGPPYLPLEISITYQQSAGKAFSAKDLRAPQLVMAGRTLPINKMQWHVAANDPSLVFSRTTDHLNKQVVGSIDSKTYRMNGVKARLATLADATPLALQLHPWEARGWFAPWKAKISRSLDTSAMAEGSNIAADLSAAGGASPTGGDWENWEMLQQVLEEKESPEQKPLSTERATSQFLDSRDASGINYYFQTQNGNQLKLRDTSSLPSWSKWLAAAALVLIGLIAVRKAPNLRQRFQRETATWGPVTQSLATLSPVSPTTGLLVGLFWWWLLSPSWLGLVVSAIAAASLIRQLFVRRRRIRRPTSGSTIHQPASP